MRTVQIAVLSDRGLQTFSIRKYIVNTLSLWAIDFVPVTQLCHHSGKGAIDNT